MVTWALAMGAPLSPVTVPSTFPVSCCAASDDATTSSVSADVQLSARKRPKALRTRRVMEFSSRGVNARQETDERSEEHTSELQSQSNLVCRLLLEKKKETTTSK